VRTVVSTGSTRPTPRSATHTKGQRENRRKESSDDRPCSFGKEPRQRTEQPETEHDNSVECTRRQARREDVLSPTSGDCTKPGKPNSGCRCKQYRTPQEGSCQQQCCREISRVEGTEQPKTSPVRSRSMLPTEKPRIAKPRTNVRPETVVVSVTGSTSPSSPSGFNPKATPLNQGNTDKTYRQEDFPADPGTESIHDCRCCHDGR